MRLDRHAMMMGMAEVAALRGTCSRLQVGAVISRDGRCISTGYNGNVSGVAHCSHDMDLGCETAMHAEANAIAFASRYGVAIEGADLYCTHEPCYHCSRLIINAGIKRVFFITPYRKHEGVELLLLVGIEVFRLNEDYSLYSVRR